MPSLWKQIAFCGLSIGSSIAQWLALNAPEKLSAIVLCNSAAKFGVPEIWDKRMAAVAEKGMSGFVENFIASGFSLEFRERNPKVIADVQEQFISCSPQGYNAVYAAARTMDFTDLVRTINLPTGIIAGEKNTSTTLDNAHYLHSQIPDSVLFTLPAALISNIEAADEFTNALLQFLQSLPH